MSKQTILASAANITTNYLPRYNGTGYVDSVLYDNGTNIGIGTNTPYEIAPSNVNIDIRSATYSFLQVGTSSTATASDVGYLEFMNGNNKRLGTIAGGADGTALAGYMRFSTANSAGNFTERMRITSSGNVGIGTSSPSRLLSLYATTPVLQFINPTTGITSNDGTQFYQNAENFFLELQDGGYYSISTGGSERMRITSGGQVNINSTQTTHPFYVQASIANWMTVMENSANSSSGLLIRQTGGAQGFYYGAYDGAAYKFFVNGSGVVNSTSTSITIISSDQKLKTDIRDYDKGLAEVLAMKPRIYKRKDNLEIDEVGFIAQEMDIALAGSMIESYKDEEGEPIHTYQLEWYPLLVKAIQELSQKVTDQQEQINQLINK